MEIAAFTGAIILSYIQTSAMGINVNFPDKNSTVLKNPVKVPKCCEEGSLMTSDSGCTRDSTRQFQPQVKVFIHNATHINDEPVSEVQWEPFNQNIDCALGSYPLLPEDNFCLLENGSLVLIDHHKILPPAQFCFETVNLGDEAESWTTTPFICAPPPPANILLIIYCTGMGISCVALALVCVIYGCFLKYPLPHKTFVICFSACFLGCYLVVGVAQGFHPTANTCDLLGILFQVLLIAALGFLALIEVEIFCSVREYKRRNKNSHWNDLKPLVVVFSAVLMIATIFLPYIVVVNVPRTFLKPALGQNSCWYTGEKIGAVYFTLPAMVQIVINIVFLAVTSINIKKLNSRFSNHTEWELLKEIHVACFVIIILMVLCWGVEMVTFFLETTSIQLSLDVLESVQGIIAFLVFVTKRYLLQRLKCCGRPMGSGYSTNGSDTPLNPQLDTIFRNSHMWIQASDI